MSAIHQKKIETIRGQIAALQAERQQVTDAPPPQSVTIERLRAHLKSAHDVHVRALRHQIARLRDGEPGTPLGMPAGGNLAPLFVALFGVDALVDALRPHIDSQPQGIDATVRAARLADLDADISRLENSEQDLIDAASAAGQPIAYRPDARPEIVLRTSV